ncbi:MAG: hypothetical protein ACE37F_13145 [Nannocystaceae bacterium]|nr:hypothetical protein [bacterium]
MTKLGGLPFEEERLRLYDLKSSAMTLMREAGVPDGHIEAAARHRGQGVTTKHYSFATDTQALSAVDRLEELLAEVRGG